MMETIFKEIVEKEAIAFNKKYNRHGALFERPFRRKHINDDSYLQNVIAYIHNNPVEEGIVFRPEDYKYSSGPDYSGENGMLDGVCVFQNFKL